MKSSTGSRVFILLLLSLILYLTYLIIKPFIHSIVIAFLIGALLAPLRIRIESRLGRRRTLATAIIVASVVIVILVPVMFFVSALITQALDVIVKINGWVRSGGVQQLLESPFVSELLQKIKPLTERFGLESLHFRSDEVTQYAVKLTQYIAQFVVSQGTAFIGNAVELSLQFIIMTMFAFYIIRDYERIIRRLKDLSPLREDQEDRIIERVREVTRSAFIGTLATAGAQGLAGGIGLAIVGIPALFWGTMMGLASLIPVMGTAMVWIPASAYLLLLGKWKSALFLVLWCALLVGLIDNFVRPIFMRGKNGSSTFLVFIAIMGGMNYFGLLGIIYGPLILGFLMVILYIYETEYQHWLSDNNDPDTPLQQDDRRRGFSPDL
ncbi:AI-2E family transporter [Thermodesulforhabdus norvegica]|uniref:Predicted PurR-regulated permease PerM n=1 Tax=Thermodesulforhabdus norvegica TaxID=39841 RepID=A0A1I4VGP3_9BACT|nr:AI-2E family transporter [Thermodesulforhabdus norvegica]SFN00339.1 Predicted PurR-regulated permease PerM [Thermodesulforhabdus norvegica]